MDEDFIKDLARKYANTCEFKSNFPHDWNSVNEGYVEGFKTALRLIDASASEKQPTDEATAILPDVIGMCEHNNTRFENIRCNCCDDCGGIIEIDV